MKQRIVFLLIQFYTWLLRLYPASFRKEFQGEMMAVFSDSLVDVKMENWLDMMMALFARELRDLPGSLIHQYWLAIRKEKDPMTILRGSNGIQSEDRQPGTWGAAFLAGLPHLLMGLLIGIGKLFDQNIPVNQSVSIVLGVSLGVAVIASLVFAWRRGWPLWSASWYLYGTWITIVIIGLIIENLDLQESWRYTNAMLFGWLIFCIIGYFSLLFKTKLHALMAIAFLFPFIGLVLLEFIPNTIEGWLAIGLGLLAAATAGAVIRAGEFRIGLGLVLGLNLIAGLSIAYISEYKMLDLPPLAPAHVPQFNRFLMNLMLYSIFSLGVVAIPFFLRGLWNFGKRKFT